MSYVQSVSVSPPIAADRLEPWLERLLGSAPAPRVATLRHVCSCWQDESGALRAIRIGPGAPPSPTDAFLLRVARAQADAIVTSGRIVRAEAALDHGLGEGALGSLLRLYRSNVLGRATPPRTLVLSWSGDLPARHPLWDDWTRVAVWTRPDEVPVLRRRLPAQVQIIAATGSGVAAALAHLQSQGACRISLELGPAAVASLYADRRVDELWCSRLLGLELAEPARGAPWPFDATALAHWICGEGSVVREASGPWHFGRYSPPW